MANREIKLRAAGHGVRMWQVAEALGMLDCSLSRKLRHELADEEKQRIMGIIDELAKEAQHEAN